MLLIPAITLKDGKCVHRTNAGDALTDDPAAVAAHWAAAGAERMHVVDLDGMERGDPSNLDAIESIIDACPGVRVQVRGGDRSEDAVQAYLDTGAAWVVIGTRAVAAPHLVNDLCMEFPEHIIVTLDVREGRLAIDGWSKFSTHDLLDTARHLERDGVAAFIYTDVDRVDTLSGANVESTVEMAQAVTMPVYACGGVSGEGCIRALGETGEENIAGVIVGRALYEGKLDMVEARQLAASYP